MGNRSRKRNRRLKKSRFLRIEPLESRLQFAVDYSAWESNFFSGVGSELLAFSESVSEWPVYEFGATAAPELNAIYELNSASKLNSANGLNSVPEISFAASHSPLPIDSLTPQVIEYLGDAFTENRGSSLDSLTDEIWLYGNDALPYAVEGPSILDALTASMNFPDSLLLDVDQVIGSTSQQASEFDDSELIAVAVPFQDQSVSLGLSSEPWIASTTSLPYLLRHGSIVDAWPFGGEAIPTVAEDVNSLNFTMKESPSRLSQSPSSDNLGYGLSSPYQVVNELSSLKFHVSSQDLQSREVSGHVDSRISLSQYSQDIYQDIYHTENTLSSQPSIELELHDQLPVDKSTDETGQIWRRRATSKVVVAAPGNTASKSTNAVLAMLPVGMLPIGNEPVHGTTSNNRGFATNQHFIVQTALICESLNTVVRNETDNEEGSEKGIAKGDDGAPSNSQQLDFASPNRSMGLVAAGFVLFVVQSRFRLPKTLRNYWEKCILQFKRPVDDL